MLVGIRDAIMISQIDSVLADARARAVERFAEWGKDAYILDFSVYGKNAVMRDLEPQPDEVGHEIGLLINLVAKSQDQANGVAMYVRGTLQHASYPGIITTAGNMAYPFSPFNVPVGPAFRFSAYHLLPLEDPCEIFPTQYIDVKN